MSRRAADSRLMFPLLGLPVAYTMLGFILGFGVTLAAWFVDTNLRGLGFSIPGVWAAHGSNPLHVFLDVAPIAFAGAGYLIGSSHGRALVLRERMRSILRGRTRDSQWRRVVAASPDGIVITDARGTILHVNPAAERVFGRRASVLVGMTIAELLQNSHRMTPETAFELRTGLGERLGTGWKLLARHGSGALVPVVVTTSPLGPDDDAPRCYRVRDVSLEPKQPSPPPTGPWPPPPTGSG